jgi:hypothetical protein
MIARDGEGAARAMRALLDTATEFQQTHPRVTQASEVPAKPRATRRPKRS